MFVYMQTCRYKWKIGHNDVHYKNEASKVAADTHGMYDARPEYVAIGDIAALYCVHALYMINYLYMYVVTTSRPLITSMPKDTTVLEGARVEFPVQVIGTPHPILTWYHNNTCVNNDYAHEISSNGTLTIVNTEMKHAGNYHLVATNSVGTVEGNFRLKLMPRTPQALTAAGSGHPVLMAEFGQYVSQNHANTNNGFIKLYHVSIHCTVYMHELV